MYLLEDPGTLDIDVVLQEGTVFHRNTEGFVNPGTSQDIIWVRLDIENVSDAPGVWVISLNRALVSNVGIFLVSNEEVGNTAG